MGTMCPRPRGPPWGGGDSRLWGGDPSTPSPAGRWQTEGGAFPGSLSHLRSAASSLQTGDTGLQPPLPALSFQVLVIKIQ